MGIRELFNTIYREIKTIHLDFESSGGGVIGSHAFAGFAYVAKPLNPFIGNAVPNRDGKS